MNKKEEILQSLEKELALLSVKIHKTEKLLQDLKEKQRKLIYSYELASKTDEKSFEELLKVKG